MPFFGNGQSGADSGQNTQLLSLNQRLSAIEAYNAGNRLGVLESVNSATRLSALEEIAAGSRLLALENIPPPSLASLGGEPAGTAAAAITAHKAETDPHSQYAMPTSHLHIWGMGKITTNSSRFFNTTLSTSAELCRYATIDTAAVGDVVEYEVFLKAGSYTLVVYGQKQSDRGIAGFHVDNKYLGKFDLYAASASSRNLFILDFTVSTSGRHSIKVVTVGKNTSSSNFFISLSAIHIRPQSISLASTFQPIRINCGANAADYIDPSGNIWGSSLFSDGLGSNYDIESYVGAYTVSNTDKQLLYKTETSLDNGSFSYKLPIFNPGPGHILNLHFSENYKTAAGERIGTVALNGSNILTNFDIFAQANGQHKALVKTFSNLNLSACVVTFTNTLINAIELLKS